MPKTKYRKRSPATPKSLETAPEENKYFSRAVGKAIQILELVSNSGNPMSLNDLSRQTQLTKSSAFRLLHTLETLHCIRRDSNGHYVPSEENRIVVSGQTANAVVTAAREPMRLLNMEFRETISLSVLMNNHIEVVHVVESPILIRMTNIVGRILPPHASSMGKVITAWQSEETRKRLLQSYGLARFTDATVTDERALEEQFEAIRAQGYSFDAEESTPGGCCFGVPIFSAPDKVEAAMSLSMPKARMPKEAAQQQQLIRTLQGVAQGITTKLSRPIS